MRSSNIFLIFVLFITLLSNENIQHPFEGRSDLNDPMVYFVKIKKVTAVLSFAKKNILLLLNVPNL